MDADREFVEYIVKKIVNRPDDATVTRKVDEMGVLLEVRVHPEDMGLLIGRSGATARAIRVLARLFGMRNNARVNLRIIEPEGSTRKPETQSPETHETKEVAPAPEPTLENGKTKDIDDVVNDIGL